MPHSIEDFCYVGQCSVCNESVDESDAGYCHVCGQAFHWGSCGEWYEGDHEWHHGEHVCKDCIEYLESIDKE